MNIVKLTVAIIVCAFAGVIKANILGDFTGTVVNVATLDPRPVQTVCCEDTNSNPETCVTCGPRRSRVRRYSPQDDE